MYAYKGTEILKMKSLNYDGICKHEAVSNTFDKDMRTLTGL